MKIQFVYFDLGNILVSFDPEIACRNVAKLIGDSADVARDLIYTSGLQDAYETGQINCDEYWHSVIESAQLTKDQLPRQQLLDAVSDMFTPINAMVSVVNHAKSKAGRIGLLSNTCPAHWHWVQAQPWPVSRLQFDVTILSCDVGSMKPDARIYQAAEQAAGVSPEQILFIDDKQENVDAALNHGWQARRCLGGDQAWRIIKDALG